MNQETLLELLSQESEETHELREIYKPILARHKEICTEQEAKQNTLETLVAFTEHYQIQTPEALHNHIKILAEGRYMQRQKPDYNGPKGSLECDWYKAVRTIISEALRIYSPKNNIFMHPLSLLGTDHPSESTASHLPQIGDHP